MLNAAAYFTQSNVSFLTADFNPFAPEVRPTRIPCHQQSCPRAFVLPHHKQPTTTTTSAAATAHQSNYSLGHRTFLGVGCECHTREMLHTCSSCMDHVVAVRIRTIKPNQVLANDPHLPCHRWTCCKVAVLWAAQRRRDKPSPQSGCLRHFLLGPGQPHIITSNQPLSCIGYMNA